MQKNKKRFLLFLLIFQVSIINLLATHNRAGEITYVQKGTHTYEVTLVTYTYSLAPADRPEIDIYFGDGTYATVARVNNGGQGQLLADNYKKNIYIVTHTYPGAGTYVITMEDPNRNEGVLNIPNSVNIKFAIKTTLQINASLGANNAPIMLNPPIDKAAKGQVFIHNPNAYDPDGDSLSYKIAVCLGDNAQPISDYTFPNAAIELKVDPVSGDLIWNYPDGIGIFNVAIEIEEWRDGIKIGSIIRDMQIEVIETDNVPPVIEALANHCVDADSVLSFTVSATDNLTEKVTLSSTGGVYQFEENPAKFDTIFGLGNVSSEFVWQTGCEHVRKQPYLVIFKATDNNADQVLSSYQNVNIHVVGPAPQNVTLEPTNSQVLVQWDPSNCTQVQGYYIYRRNRREYFRPEQCEVGMPYDTEYQLIATVEGVNNSEYVDNDNGDGLAQGFEYCYMIVAFYPDGALSYASREVCVELTRGIPIMLKASVSTTDIQNGAIHLEWMEPLDFDYDANPGPYRYFIFPSNDLTGNKFTDPFYVDGISNTSVVDTNFNTLELPRIYRMGLYNYDAAAGKWNIIGVPEEASSLFLTLTPRDNEVELNVEANVPWENYQYVIYRKKPEDTDWDTIAFTNSKKYIDRGLKNGETYCYKVKSVGQYGLDIIPKPLYNYSQELCTIPIDTVPSCSPTLTVINNCDSTRNELVWTNPNNECSDDVVGYNIYYFSTLDGEPTLIKEVDDPKDTVFWHEPSNSLAGCYLVTAVDSFQNESSKNYRECADNCPFYSLPNSFSPNGDGTNDLFIPYPYQFVEKVEMKIYSRWGNLVYETSNPDINWDGRNQQTNKIVPSGVYYYVCDVWERRLQGEEVRNLSGFIHVFTESVSNSTEK